MFMVKPNRLRGESLLLLVIIFTLNFSQLVFTAATPKSSIPHKKHGSAKFNVPSYLQEVDEGQENQPENESAFPKFQSTRRMHLKSRNMLPQKFANFGESCEGSLSCNTSAQLFCINGKCSCMSETKTAYDEEKATCVALPGHLCNTNKKGIGCVKNAECDFKKKICQCLEGYVNEGRSCEIQIEDDGVDDEDIPESETGDVPDKEKPAINVEITGGEESSTFNSGVEGDVTTESPIIPQEEKASSPTINNTGVENIAETSTVINTLDNLNTDTQIEVEKIDYMNPPQLPIPSPIPAPPVEDDFLAIMNKTDSVSTLMPTNEPMNLYGNAGSELIQDFKRSEKNIEKEEETTFPLIVKENTTPEATKIITTPFSTPEPIIVSTTLSTTTTTTTTLKPTTVPTTSVPTTLTSTTPMTTTTPSTTPKPTKTTTTTTPKSTTFTVPTTTTSNTTPKTATTELSTTTSTTPKPTPTSPTTTQTPKTTPIPKNITTILQITTQPLKASLPSTTTTPINTTTQMHLTVADIVRLGDLCHEEYGMKCGKNAECVEIGSSTDYMCVCLPNFSPADDSGTNCESVKKTFNISLNLTSTLIGKVDGQRDHLGDKNANLVRWTTIINSTHESLNFVPINLINVGDSCAAPNSAGLVNEITPEMNTCVRNAECVTITSFFQELQVCKCSVGFTKTVNGKCASHTTKASSASKVSFNSDYFNWMRAISLHLLCSFWHAIL